MFTSDVTFFRTNQPFVILGTAYRGNSRMTVYFRSHVAGTRSHSLGEVGGLDVSVFWVDDRSNQTIRITERLTFFNAIGAKKFNFNAKRCCNTRVLAILIHAIGLHSQANITHLS